MELSDQLSVLVISQGGVDTSAPGCELLLSQLHAPGHAVPAGICSPWAKSCLSGNVLHLLLGGPGRG